jgi:hypothetical protein
MSKNTKHSSRNVGALAAKTPSDPKSSKTAKSLAGSALAQTNTDRQTGAELEDRAAKVLRSPKYSDDTKALAGSVLSQANKER